MRNNLKKGFCLLLVAWLMVANVGFAWSQSTCLFTGIQKTSWQYKANCCGKKASQNPVQKTTFSRASCCHYQHFQVKHQASFVIDKKSVAFEPFVNSIIVSSFSTNRVLSEEDPSNLRPLFVPLPAERRRALLQVYRI